MKLSATSSTSASSSSGLSPPMVMLPLLLAVASTLPQSVAAFRPVAPGPLFRRPTAHCPNGRAAGAGRASFLVRPFPRVLVSTAASTLEAPRAAPSGGNSTLTGGSWECNGEAECVEVPQCDEEVCRTSLDVRIHGAWYDLTGTCHQRDDSENRGSVSGKELEGTSPFLLRSAGPP